MEDSFHSPSRTNSNIIGVISSKKVSEGHLVSSFPWPLEHNSFKKMAVVDHGKIIKRNSGHIALFLLKTVALDTVRRFSTTRCPFVWSGLQALQLLCYPPFKWLQKWDPFRVIIRSMQTLSGPLLVLSIATAFSNKSDFDDLSANRNENSCDSNDSNAASESQPEVSSLQPASNSRICDVIPSVSSPNWLLQLYAELENQGIDLPERINEDEIQLFYSAANGNFSCLLAAVKNTIRWREHYRILKGVELETWSNIVFWHGFDVKQRPCLVVRLGLACLNLPYDDRPHFAQAVVSQVDHGILHLVNNENPQITVLVDCEGLTPLRVPMKMMRSCSNLLQNHYPNRLGSLLIIHLPPVVRVIAQTFIQVIKPATRKKLKIVGDMYYNVLSEYLQTVPSYLGGKCTCLKCETLAAAPLIFSPENGTMRRIEDTGFQSDSSNHSIIGMDVLYHQGLRATVVALLIFLVFTALLNGIYDP